MKDWHHVCSIMPLEAFVDHRLGLVDLRVLGAIFSWRNRDTSVAKAYRYQIANRCGYTDSTISRATARLVKLGWLEKEGKGGSGLQVKYKITVPELGTVAQQATVAEPDKKRWPNRTKNGGLTGHTLQSNHRVTTKHTLQEEDTPEVNIYSEVGGQT